MSESAENVVPVIGVPGEGACDASDDRALDGADAGASECGDPGIELEDRGAFCKVDPRSIPADRVSWWILEGLVGGGALVFLGLMWLGGWGSLASRIVQSGIAVMVVVVLHVFSVVLPKRVYEATSYRLGDGGIEIRRGIWWKRVINVPRSRIQHTDVTQGPVARHYGVATLTVHTAGTESANVTLEGTARETALAARDALLEGGAEA